MTACKLVRMHSFLISPNRETFRNVGKCSAVYASFYPIEFGIQMSDRHSMFVSSGEICMNFSAMN